MHKTSILFVAALSFAAFGCSKKKGADCEKAIAHSMELSKDSMAKMGVDDKMMGKMHDLAVKNCKEDKWADEAVACMIAAKTEGDAQACYGKLTAEQQAKTNKAAMELAPAPAAPAPAPPAPAAPAGSAAEPPAPGSAGSGSAAAPAAGSDTAGSAAAPK